MRRWTKIIDLNFVKMSPSPSEGMKIWVRHCDLNITISASKPITNLNCVFIHSCLKNGTIWLITTKISLYWANIDKNGFPGLTSARNLARCDNLAHAQMPSLYVNNGALLFFQHCSPQKCLISSTFKVFGEYIGQIDRPFDGERLTYSKLVLNVRCAFVNTALYRKSL